jgi:nucleotide-binding universal stress UspA family protein
MKTILFPTDFSTNAIHASLYAAMLAEKTGAKIIILHGYPVPIPIAAEQQLIFDTEISVIKSEADATENLAAFTQKFITDTHLPTTNITQMIEYGLLSDVIIKVASTTDIDCIVMGTKGTGDAIDRWIGTNAQSVIEVVECPVWLIPEKTPINLPKSIMYAADFEEDEALATKKVLDIAQPLGASCNVIHIHEKFEVNTTKIIEKEINDLENTFGNEDVTFKNLNRDGVVDSLETYIKTNKPDVLALAVYEKSFLSKMFNSSISQYFVEEASLPMLTFKKR